MVAAYTACNEVYIYDDGSVTSLSDLLNTNNTTAKTKITAFGIIDGYFINNTNMNKMCYDCKALTSLELSGLDTSNVTTMWGMFSGCSGLTSLDVSGWDTSNVTDTSNMLGLCQSLTSLKWTNWLIAINLSLTKLTSECVKDLIKNLGRVDSEQTLTLNKTLAGYLDKLDMMYATTKGWVITPDAVGIKYANVTSSTDLSSVTDTTYKICIVE